MAAKKQRKPTSEPAAAAGAFGFESKLGEAADKMRGHMDAGECTRVVRIVCIGQDARIDPDVPPT